MERDIIVISDLHLSEGIGKDTGKISRNEDFFFDNEFSKFIDYLIAQKDKSWNLIINGDFFDFLQVIVTDKNKPTKKNRHYELKMNDKVFKLRESEKEFGLGTDEEKSILKMRVIAEGHRTFFKALYRFLIKGNNLSIIKGNHDVELHWDGVKEEFKNQIITAGLNKEDENVKNIKNNKKKLKDEDIEDIKKRINFYPWIYCDSGIYIEHGNQYEKGNSFEYFLQPTLPKPNENEIYLPIGSFFTRYLFNKVEAITPFADNIKPVTNYIVWIIRNKLFYLWKIIGKYVFLLLSVLKKTRNFTEEQMKKIKDANDKKLHKLSQLLNLEESKLRKIDNMKEIPILKSKSKVLIIMCKELFFGFIFFILTGLLFYYLWLYLKPLRQLLIFLILTLIYFLPSIINSFIKPSKKYYLRDKAKSIYDCLGKKVKYIIFGHLHDPDILKISKDCYYYNTSTWTTVFSEEEQMIRGSVQFPFLHIPTNKKPKLLCWNNNTGEPELLKLFEE